MKLVIEHSDRVYAYFEKDRHHKKMNGQRDATREVPAFQLDEECDLSISLPKGTYMVIPVKKTPKRKKNNG
jgi:hypothetical protein